jgi:hypothetical protein
MNEPKQAMEQALGALIRMCQNFPTDDDMSSIGWETHEINAACDSYDAGQAAIAALRSALSSIPDVQVDSIYEQRLRSVLDVVMRWLTPDGIDSGAAMGEIIGLVDPWPLSAASAPKEPQ